MIIKVNSFTNLMKMLNNKKGEALSTTIIGIIVAIAIVLAIVPSLINDSSVVPELTEDIVLINNTAVSLTNDDVIALVLNQTNGAMVEDVNYTMSKTDGTVTLILNNANGTATAVYTYYGDTTVRTAMGRTIVGLIVLLFAVALLVAVYKIAM